MYEGNMERNDVFAIAVSFNQYENNTAVGLFNVVKI